MLQATTESSTAAGQARKRGRPPKQPTTVQPPSDDTTMQPPTNDNEDPQAPLTQELIREPNQKKKRGRPPKASNTQVNTRKKPAGVGVLVGDDGHTYLSSTRSTVRLTQSDSRPSTNTAEG